MTTLQHVELGVLGPLQVRQYGLPVSIPGAKPRAILTMLGLHAGSVVAADTLLELLWGDDPPRTAAKALQTHISALRRTLGDGFVLTQGTGWTLATADIDASRYADARKLGRDAMAAGDVGQAMGRFDEALALWRGVPELPDGPRGVAEKTRWIEDHAALVEDRAETLLATGRAAEIIGELEAALGDAPLRERRWGQLMLALYRAGRQGEALAAYQRARSLLANELGVDPGPELRRLEAAIVAQDESLEIPVAQRLSSVTRAVTFLLTDIEGSTAAWEADADAMAVALARHDEIVEQVVTSRGGRLVKTRGEGDATFSVFDRPSAAAAAAVELQEAIRHEPWALAAPMRIRVALHTGEVELRDGDYFGRAVNRAARLRSLATGGQILCSGATAELVIDTLADDVVLADLGTRQLKNLARPEHVFELRLETSDDARPLSGEVPPIERPDLPGVLAGSGPFVGRGPELERLLSAWQTGSGAHAVLIAGEPGVGKTRLAGEWSRLAYEQGAVVLYGRCDEDLGAPYQPFAEALRSLIPCLGSKRLRGLRGVESLIPLVPGLTDELPDLSAPARADADTERYALFDAVVALLGVVSTSAPVVLVLDDLHWAAKPTLLLLRHLLRFGEQARVQIVGTYRSTDLDRSHPLAGMLADLHRDGSAHRLALSGLDERDVTAYLAEAGYDDEELARALASVTGGNPFFLIEALRHVDESGGRWDPSTLPQGVREAVSRRLSRLGAETNKALAAAAVVGSRFALDLVERVTEQDLIDAFDEASKAGILIEEPGGRYRFNHALVRQSLLAELASVRRMRLHQRIATTLEDEPGADEERLAELAYHYFECAWAGNAAKAVEYCRRAADQAMARLAYEGAADYYDKALHALDELDDELPDREDLQAELLVARCEALLAAGDVVAAADAVSQLQSAAGDSARLAAWGACFDGEISMLTDPERLDEIATAVAAAAAKLAGLDDAAGEAKAHTVRAMCLGRLGRIADCEAALDQALTAARRAREHRRVNAVLATAPLAALWGPTPVPRAGGRCLDVVRLLRITTGSPVVEATSTRCQGLLDAFRGRAAAGRQLIDSARRSLSELGMRHALLEVEQFAGIVELVADDASTAEPHLRRAYNGFRRMGLDADTAETAALLARACLALDRDGEADELCTESERLAGHALKAAIAWRTVRAQILSRAGAHEEARQLAEQAVAMAERTDALVDHGDARLALATVLFNAGDVAGGRTAAEQAVDLYERKGAAALADKARETLGTDRPAVHALSEAPVVEPENACVRTVRLLDAAYDREDWAEIERHVAAAIATESRRRVVGLSLGHISYGEWEAEAKSFRQTLGPVRYRHVVVAVRGERLALTRLEVGTADVSPGAPRDEWLQLYGIDEDGRIALQVWFDADDIDAAIAELDAAHARFETAAPRPALENTASRADARFNALCADRRWDGFASAVADDVRIEDRRRGLHTEHRGRTSLLAEAQTIGDLGTESVTSEVLAIRGERLALVRSLFLGQDKRADAFRTELLRIVEVDSQDRITAFTVFDVDSFDSAIAELDARYLAGEAAGHAHAWSKVAQAYGALNRRRLPETAPDWVNIDHRRLAPVEPGRLGEYIRDASSELGTIFISVVHRLGDTGAVVGRAVDSNGRNGFDAEWREIDLLIFDGNSISRLEVFDEADLDAAIARFDELCRPAHRLKNAANRVLENYLAHFATRSWDVMAQALADDLVVDDRRRVVNSGVRHSREAEIVNVKAMAEVGCAAITTNSIAVRGERLVLSSHSFVAPDWPDLGIKSIDVAEINADNRIVASIVFDPDDIDAAFNELDARYLAGEAAEHAQTWALVAAAYAGANRHELAPMTPNHVSLDHHRASFGPGDLTANLRAALAQVPDVTFRVEVVHRLSDLGAVVTHVARGTSREGFEAEWREIHLMTVEGALFNRSEIFDEADLDAAVARFDQLSRSAYRPEDAASRVVDRYLSYFTARDWESLAAVVAEDIVNDDRRRVLNAGTRRGRDAEVANLRAVADVALAEITSSVIASRGDRLILTRLSGREHGPHRILNEVLGVFEINANNVIEGIVVFDLSDLDAAFAELETRYIAGEGAPYRRVWQQAMDALDEVNRHQLGPVLGTLTYVDHRQISFGSGDFGLAVGELWHLVPDARYRLAAVHALDNHGIVGSLIIEGTNAYGNELQWSRIVSVVPEEHRMDVYDDDDLAAALADFEGSHPQVRRLENTATRVGDRYFAHFAGRDWDALADVVAEQIFNEDRRRVVNTGIRHGRDSDIENMRAAADLGFESLTSDVLAIRGERLVLSSVSGHHPGPDAFVNSMLGVVEIDSDDRIAAIITFDLDDLDAAFAELDNRYLAGEGAAHADVWSVVVRNWTAFNRHEMPATTPDWVTIDHRRGGTSFEPGDLSAYIRSTWDITPEVKVRIESVHRVSDRNALLTQVSSGTTTEGFQVEWREIVLLAIDGEIVTRCELFDEADLTTALECFESINTHSPWLKNAASQAYERLQASFAARDWDGWLAVTAADIIQEDRRRVIHAEPRRGKDAAIAEARAVAQMGVKNVALNVMAVRGERVALIRSRFSGGDPRPTAFHTDTLCLVEIDSDNRISRHVMYDPDDIDAAFAELDTRYLSGEASTHARTWSVVAEAFAAVARHELPPTKPDWVHIDHRRGTPLAGSDLTAVLSTARDVTPDLNSHIETVHLLTDKGAVVTQISHGTSQAGFDAEWRMINLMTVEGHRLSRCELFDETDVDVALARFDELSRPAPPENAASRLVEGYASHVAAHDWDKMAAWVAEDFVSSDRRRTVNSETRYGRDAEFAAIRAAFDVGLDGFSAAVIATRGDRVALCRAGFFGESQQPEAFGLEFFAVVEIDADQQLVARVTFDLDDIEAAFEELEARYLAREAAPYSEVWSGLVGMTTAVNRHEFPPTTPDVVSIDNRKGTAFAPGELAAYVRAAWEVTPQSGFHIEQVHRLNSIGGVVTHAGDATSQEGFTAEWRVVVLATFEGDLVSSCELFDESDLDTALARFDELNRPRAPLANAASRLYEQYWSHFATRDWDALAALLASDFVSDDRRHVVNSGLRHGRDADLANLRALAHLGVKSATPTVIATRGKRLALNRVGSEAFRTYVLNLVEMNDEGLITAIVGFDLDDLDAAVQELDNRYVGGEARAYSRTWSVIASGYTAFNRRELPPITPDWVNIDHRRGGRAFAPGEQVAYMQATWDIAPAVTAYAENIHRLNALGAVVTQVVRATSQDGFDAEWREVSMLTVAGDRINRCEMFDALDEALVKFDELCSSATRLENAAVCVDALMSEAFNARDLERTLSLHPPDARYEDRRRGLRDEGPIDRRYLHSVLFDAPATWQLETEAVAIRGDRLCLTRARFRDTSASDQAVAVELLAVWEITAQGLASYAVFFDPDDINGATAELTARWIAAGEVAHPEVIEAAVELFELTNLHEWEALSAREAGAACVNHRQLGGAGTAVDHWSSVRTMASLIPDMWIEQSAILNYSAVGVVTRVLVKGTTGTGSPVELPAIIVHVFDGGRLTRMEAFDFDQLDMALARFEELNAA